MAELKAETTVGGSLVWTQGNFPLFPTGNTLVYKTYKVYSEYDKPQAVDNDFVSKADGGKYLSLVDFNKGIQVYPSGNLKGTIEPGTGDGATDMSTNPASNTANLHIKSHWGLGIGSYQSQGIRIIMDARNGDISTTGNIRLAGQVVIRANSPLTGEHATRKDYVDSAINTVTNNANSRVLRAGDTMDGPLIAPNVSSTNAASQPAHLTRFDQVVLKGTIIDFNTY